MRIREVASGGRPPRALPILGKTLFTHRSDTKEEFYGQGTQEMIQERCTKIVL